MTKVANLICGSIFTALAVGIGLVSMGMNVAHGLEVSAVAALIFGFAEAGRISIPIVASLRGWNIGLVGILIVCGITSITAAVSNFADRNADRLLKAEAINDQHDRLKADYDRVRGEVATLAATGKPEDLEALAKVYKKKAADEAARGFCGPKCQDAERNHANTLAALAQARRKAELEGKLVTIEAALAKTSKVEISGRAKMAASWMGLSKENAMMLDGMFDSLLTIAVIESLVYLGIFGIPMLLTGLGCQPEEAPEPASAPVIQLAEKREDEIRARMISMILRSEDGSICCSGRELASRLKVPHSTFSIWLARWIEKGLIIAEPVTAHKRRYRAAA